MTRWRYFARFNPRLNGPVPGFEDAVELDEAEARRRYRTPGAFLDIVPAVAGDDRVPFMVRVSTADVPSFLVSRLDEDGHPTLSLAWVSEGEDRVFLRDVEIRDYAAREWGLPFPRSETDWDTQIRLRLLPGAPSRLSIAERGSSDVTTGEIDTDTSAAFRAAPAWGEWDALLDDGGFAALGGAARV